MQKIKIEELDVVAVIEQVRSGFNDVCPACKVGYPVRKEDHGYMTARDLGRPAGAKGKDVSSVWMECENCGHKTDVYQWPVKLEWRCVIEDNYGNYLTDGHAFTKVEAIQNASTSYENMSQQMDNMEDDEFYGWGDC